MRVFLKRGIDDLDRVDLTPSRYCFTMNSDGRPDLGERDAVVDREVGDEIAARTGEELCAFPADDVELSRGLDLRGELEKVAVESAAEAFVRRDQQDPARLDGTFHQEGMARLVHPGGDRRQHVGHEIGVGPAREGDLLRLFHLRRRHQLHRLGDLAGVFDRLDASAKVAGGGHGLAEEGGRKEN